MRRWIMLLNADEQIASGMQQQHESLMEDDSLRRNKWAEEEMTEEDWGCYGDDCYDDDDYLLNERKKNAELSLLHD